MCIVFKKSFVKCGNIQYAPHGFNVLQINYFGHNRNINVNIDHMDAGNLNGIQDFLLILRYSSIRTMPVDLMTVHSTAHNL